MSVRRADGVIAAQVVVRSKSSIAAKVKHLLEIVCVTFVTRGRGEAFPFGAELAPNWRREARPTFRFEHFGCRNHYRAGRWRPMEYP